MGTHTEKHAGTSGDTDRVQEGGNAPEGSPGVTVIGVDPGVVGAIVEVGLYDEITVDYAADMPIMMVGDKRVVDPHKVMNIFKHDIVASKVAIEQPFALPKSGAIRALQQGRNWGIVWGAAGAVYDQVYDVRPVDWKRYHGLLKMPKNEVLNKAHEIVSAASHHHLKGQTKQHTIARCEAALIGIYCATREVRTPGE